MSEDIGKKGISYLYELYDKNDPNAFINQETQNIQIDFIGGEPLLNVKTIEAICDEFFRIGLEKHHPWIENCRFSISTNGTLYFNEDVQHFLKKYHNFTSLAITIDGPQNLHDSCRKYCDGRGSWEDVMAAVQDYRKNYGKIDSTKITLSHENLPYLNQIVNWARDNGFKNIASNTIAEYEWQLEDAQLFYKQLIEMANTILTSIEKNDENDIASTLFDSRAFIPMTTDQQDNWCGGTGEMLSFDYQGLMYPCIRYMESSLGNDVPPVLVGDLKCGLCGNDCYKKNWNNLIAVTRRSQSDDECFYCPIAQGCGWCSAWNYQYTGSFNKRAKLNCIMHQARSLANVYFWNKYYESQGREKRLPLYLPAKKAIAIIGEEEYNNLLRMSEHYNEENI